MSMKSYILYLTIIVLLAIIGFSIWYFFSPKHVINKPQTYTKIEIDTLKKNFGVMSIKDTSRHDFIIKNIGSEPLLIKFIQTDCGCTIANWDTNPILPGNQTNIKIQITPIESGYFSKKIVVFCNDQRSPFYLRINGNVLNN